MKHVLKLWEKYKPLVQRGYEILEKEVTLGLPAPCMPPVSADKDTGIGTAYGAGAARVADFWQGVVHKIQLGPDGRTTAESGYSPYVNKLGHNPFFIPLENLVDRGLIQPKTLETIYARPKTDGKINFAQVDKDYQSALTEAYHTSQTTQSMFDFTEQLYRESVCQPSPLPYIGDFPVHVPTEICEANKYLFFKNFSLGTPPDSFGRCSRNWHFKIFNPDLLFTPSGELGPSGRLMFSILSDAMKNNKGGLRIDHFIGFVNPYLIYQDRTLPSGRLYSSPDHPVFKRFLKTTVEEFANITQKILLKAAAENGLTTKDIYIEDIGARPPQLDPVIQLCGLGRMLVAQFVDIEDTRHIYHLPTAQPNDVATLDTHDTPSIQSFYTRMPLHLRCAHAAQIAIDLRIPCKRQSHSPQQLTRMAWASLLACPATRVQAFFTSFTGQAGRYNKPGRYNNETWTLRCATDFERLYFKNLVEGMAYNPFDAIMMAIYARGDGFYAGHERFVRQLNLANREILHAALAATKRAG